jgi:hypothetical protein
VSAFEPQPPTEPKVDLPDFMVVLRGYDRRQVEIWAAEIANQIEQERLRADEAEKQLYRMQIENKGAPSFSHLGTHVASILEEAGRSSENMLADAAERAQEAVDAAEEEAGEIIKASEHRAGEIEQEARQSLEESRAEGARVEEEALQAAEEMRTQAEQDARTVLEEARDATDMIWQEAERERIAVEAETIRLETLRHRSLEQLGRVYGHLESVLDEVRAGIGRVEEEEMDMAEATAAAAARLGVEPPAATPEESPRFPSVAEGQGSALDQGPGDAGHGVLAATRPETTTPGPVASAAAPAAAMRAERAREVGLSSDLDGATDQDQADDADEPGRHEARARDEAGEGPAQQPTLTDAAGDGDGSPTQGDADAGTTQTQPVTAAADEGAGHAPNGESPTQDDDATQRLEPVGGKPRPAPKDPKGSP